MSKWDYRFLEAAEHFAGWSKDPSTKVGAVIVRPDRTIASFGYNGFSRGVEDDVSRYEDRDFKYEAIVHGEMNAILAAREPLQGYTLYTWPLPPCSRCAAMIIQTGIMRVVSPPNGNPRFADSCKLGQTLFREARIECVELPSQLAPAPGQETPT
jgi:dCMP deaminase